MRQTAQQRRQQRVTYIEIRNKITHTWYSISSNDSPDATRNEKYLTGCMQHGVEVTSPTLKLARASAVFPDFCEQCQTIVAPGPRDMILQTSKANAALRAVTERAKRRVTLSEATVLSASTRLTTMSAAADDAIDCYDPHLTRSQRAEALRDFNRAHGRLSPAAVLRDAVRDMRTIARELLEATR